MKILFAGIDKQFLKSFAAYMPQAHDIFISASEAESGKYEFADLEFKNQDYDAVVFFSFSGKTDDGEFEAAELVAFKNIQYAAILHGVKKLVAVIDAAEYGANAEDAFEPDGDVAPIGGAALKAYLIRALASKDKISSTFRIFELYGKGIKGGVSDIINAATTKKSFKIKNDKTVSAVYALDAAKIITKFLENDFVKGDYNIAPSEPITYIGAAKKARLAAKKLGKECEYTILDSQSNIVLTGLNIKLSLLLPDFKFTSLSSAITKILNPEPKAASKPKTKSKAKSKPKARAKSKSKSKSKAKRKTTQRKLLK